MCIWIFFDLIGGWVYRFAFFNVKMRTFVTPGKTTDTGVIHPAAYLLIPLAGLAEWPASGTTEGITKGKVMANKKVQMLVQISGARDGKDWPAAGEEITLPADEADMLIRNGQAKVPGAESTNALADVLGVETAALNDAGTAKGQKAIRTQVKPAPHADEPDAYHVPAMPGEKAAAEAGQKAVDAANKDAKEGGK